MRGFVEQSENSKSDAKLSVHRLKNPPQKAMIQKMDVRKTQGRRPNGTPKASGAMAVAPINRVERVPNHFKIWRLENMASPCTSTVTSLRRAGKFFFPSLECEMVEAVFVIIWTSYASPYGLTVCQSIFSPSLNRASRYQLNKTLRQ